MKKMKKMKKILFIFFLLHASYIIIAQNNSNIDIEIEYLQTIDQISREKKLSWLENFSCSSYRTISPDKKRQSKLVFEQNRNSMLKLMLIGFDTVFNHINWEFQMSKKKTISISDYPSVTDETDSLKAVYPNMPPSDLKNPGHRKLYEEELVNKTKDIEYRSQQTALKHAYDKFYEYIDLIVKEYYQNTENDKQSLRNLAERYLSNRKEKEKILLCFDKSLSNIDK
jgi:hypothetical protein